MTKTLRSLARCGVIAAVCGFAATALAGPAAADATDDFPIPHRMIITTCDTEQYMAAAQYSEDTATNVYYENVATHWGNWAKLFFNNKGVVAHATDVCMNYPKGDMSIWNWEDTP
jgi:hypothetical protein